MKDHTKDDNPNCIEAGDQDSQYNTLQYPMKCHISYINVEINHEVQVDHHLFNPIGRGPENCSDCAGGGGLRSDPLPKPQRLT